MQRGARGFCVLQYTLAKPRVLGLNALLEFTV